MGIIILGTVELVVLGNCKDMQKYLVPTTTEHKNGSIGKLLSETSGERTSMSNKKWKMIPSPSQSCTYTNYVQSYFPKDRTTLEVN